MSSASKKVVKIGQKRIKSKFYLNIIVGATSACSSLGSGSNGDTKNEIVDQFHIRKDDNRYRTTCLKRSPQSLVFKAYKKVKNTRPFLMASEVFAGLRSQKIFISQTKV
jgi:hypothetical protein